MMDPVGRYVRVEDIIWIIFELLGADLEYMKSLWDLGDDARDELIEIIYLSYLIKTRP
jgi:hypothetical protein